MTSVSILQRNFHKNIDKFAQKLYWKLRSSDDSFVISPVSIYACMSLIYCGASGSTAQGLFQDLPLPTQDKNRIGFLFTRIFENLKKTDQLSVAFNLFLNQDVRVRNEFLEFAFDYFNVRPNVVNFRNHIACARRINDFADIATDGKMDRVCEKDDITPDMRIIAACVFSYGGKWKKPFMRYETKRNKFWTTKEDAIEIEMMSQKENFNYRYSTELDADLLELPYNTDGVSLIIVLPKKPGNLTDVETNLSKVKLFSLTEGMVPTNLHVKLPVFSVTSGYHLGEMLTELGMGKMFSFDAEFEDLCSKGQEKINKFFGKAIFKVNEEGADHKIATSNRNSPRTSLSSKFSQKTKTEPFIANHPFIFFMKNDNCILCMGRYLGK